MKPYIVLDNNVLDAKEEIVAICRNAQMACHIAQALNCYDGLKDALNIIADKINTLQEEYLCRR